MALAIVNWNIAEKSTWFVRLADSGSAVAVELYVTQADAEAQTNLQASGESAGYGSGLEVELTDAAGELELKTAVDGLKKEDTGGAGADAMTTGIAFLYDGTKDAPAWPGLTNFLIHYAYGIDLGTPTEISKLIMYDNRISDDWYGGRDDIEIWASNDNVTYGFLQTYSNPARSQGVTELVFTTPATYRYWKVFCSSAADGLWVDDGYWCQIAELECCGERGSTAPVSLFQEDYSWHLTVAGQSEDDTKIFKVKEFVEMDEISHSIYRNSELITARATAEINAHTHAAIIRNISLGTHLPEIEVGDIAELDSDRRGVDDLSQVYEHQIVGTPDSLVSEIETRKYLELKR